MLARTRYLVASVLVGMLLAACSHSSPAQPSLPDATTPSAYHIVYRLTIAGSPGESESLWVVRPFESVDQILSGPPPGGSLVLATASRLGEQVAKSGQSAGALLYAPAAPAQFDVRLDLVLPSAIRNHQVQALGQSKILGRPCRIYRSAQSLREPGPLAVLHSGGTYVDTCIDNQGLVLLEVSYQNGRVNETRQAVSVQAGAGATDGADFNMSGESTPFDEGGGFFHHLTATSAPPGPSWAPSWLPPGYRFAGKYDVVPAQPQAFDSPDNGVPNPLGLPGSLVTELDDVYVSGPDTIVLEQGGTLNGATFAAPTGGIEVTLGQLGKGQLTLSPDGPVVSAEPTKGFHFVRLVGTLPADQLLRVAQSLVPQAPGKLVTIP